MRGLPDSLKPLAFDEPNLRSNSSDGDSSKLNCNPIEPEAVSTEGHGRFPSRGSGSISSCSVACPVREPSGSSRIAPTRLAALSTASSGVVGELAARSSGDAAASTSSLRMGTWVQATPWALAR